MNRKPMLNFAASIAIVMAGTAVPMALTAGSGDTAAQPERADRAAERANRMLDRGRTEQAVRFGEEAVAQNPNDPAHRVLLGQIYMAAGRFQSAEESFAAARELGAVTSGAIVGHALSLIAVGQAGDAVQLLDANMANIPASDYGLALALAGQGERGAMVLTDVVRQPDATARDRQNLALAYAAAGRWLEAQLIAAQVVGPQVSGQRVQQWASMLQAGDPRMRVAGLIGSTPVDDEGMPVRLALGGGSVRPVAAAMTAGAADPAPLAMYAPPPPEAPAAPRVDVAYEAPAAEQPPMEAPVMAAAEPEAPAPVAVVAEAAAPEPAALSRAEVQQVAMTFYSDPVIQPLRAAMALVAPVPARATNRAAAPRVPAARVAAARPAARVSAAAPAARGPLRTSGWAVQLGAYESNGVARDGWSRMSARNRTLASRDAITTSADVSGRRVYRLMATGFDNRAQAQAACRSVSASIRGCFVRQLSGQDRVQWSSRPQSTRLAMR